jgi:hypothetical protein
MSARNLKWIYRLAISWKSVNGGETCSRSCVETTLPLLTSYKDSGITQKSSLPTTHHSLLLALTAPPAIFRPSVAHGYSLALTRNCPGRPFTMHEGRSIDLLAFSDCFRLETVG